MRKVVATVDAQCKKSPGTRRIIASCALITLTLAVVTIPARPAWALPPAGYGTGSSFCSDHGGTLFTPAIDFDNVYACDSYSGGNAPLGQTPFDEDGNESFQCVELSGRFLWSMYGRWAGPGSDSGNLNGYNFVSWVGKTYHIPIGTPSPSNIPVAGDIVSFQPGNGYDAGVGHTAVVIASNPAKDEFTMMSQNWTGTEPGIEVIRVGSGSDAGMTQYSTDGGKYFDGNWDGTNFLELSGPSWATQSTPNVTTAVSSVLNGVSCPTATDCIAVGQDMDSAARGYALAEQWNGTAWTLQSIPNPPSTKKKYSGALLSAVSCPTATDCMAVGNATNKSEAELALIEQWNGTRWAIQSVPNPRFTNQSFLSGVSCSTATACTAVGQFNTTNGGQFTLAERWNGKSWTVQSTPITADGSSGLDSVSCPSSTACFAVGSYSTKQASLTERWNGKSWAIQSTPEPVGYPQSVSCSSVTTCTAVGAQDTERWNGKSWTIQTDTITLADRNGVSCPSTMLCVAVGSQGSSSLTLAEQWNGENWSAQSTASPSDTFNGLAGVDCSSSTRCTAVGSYEDSSGHYLTLAEDVSSLSPL